jgi:hypothetical protein
MNDQDTAMAPEYLIEQSTLDQPPTARSDRMFFTQAIAHVGRSKIPDWNDAERTAHVHDEHAANQVKKAYDVLCQSIIDGEVNVYVRPVDNVTMWADDTDYFTHAFQSVDLLRRGMCIKSVRTTPPIDGPFKGLVIGTDWEYFLFVDRSQLFAVFPERASIDDLAPTGINPENLSDYMLLALRVASDGFGATFTGEKKEIVRQLFKRAPEFGFSEGSLTDPVAGNIATNLRNKDAQAGKAGPLRRKKEPKSQ